MALIYALLIVFLLIAIAEQIYFYRKISGAVRYFGSNLSNGKKILLTVGIFLLTFVPVPFAFVEWFILEMHIAVFLLCSDLAAFVAKKVGRKKNIKYPGWLKIAYKTGAVALLLTVAVLCYGKYNMYHVIRTDYNVTVNKSLSHEYKVALVADLHYGISIDGKQLQAVADAIEKESPDFVILCGDIVDESTTLDGLNEAFSILGNIDSKFGIYYVYGNHDKSRLGLSGRFTDMQLANAIRSNRVEIMEDNVVQFNNDMLLVGRMDKMERAQGGKSIDELLVGADKSKVIVVADHQPNDYEALSKAGCDLVVSGHTHGGQLFPFGEFSQLIRANDMTYGYKKVGDLNAVFTSGIAGRGFDMRTERHSEYVMIHMKGKQS